MKRADHASALLALDGDALTDYLLAHSGLPGPRANLTLLDAAGDVLPRSVALSYTESSEEYLACCGTVALGRLIVEGETALADRLRQLAADDRWRVREAVAIAAQRIGDADPALLRTLVATWVSDPNPLVVRAGIAAICEPRLLAEPATAQAAIEACRTATAGLVRATSAQRRLRDFRTLRQALGYCWSVAVAGDPDRGMPAFLALDTSDPDLAWVDRENRRKRRLVTLLNR